MLFAIGAGERLVGVSSFDTYPPEVTKIPRVGGLLDPDLERVLALRPDLVITYGTQQDLRAQLQRARIETFSYTHGSLADIIITMRALGQRVGLPAGADVAARRLEAQLKRVSDRIAGLKRPRTMLIFGRERGALRGIYASGGRGFLHDVLEVAGGDDVFKDIDRESVQVTSELALTRAPEVIIELHPDVQLDDAAIARERQVWRPLGSIPAVRNSRIYLLTGPELVLAGPRIGEVAERFARVLHPE